MGNRMKRGYPRANYTDADVGKMIDEAPEFGHIVMIGMDEYRRMTEAAARVTILEADIMTRGKIDENVVRACLGMPDSELQKEVEKFRDWWCEEVAKRSELEETLEKFKAEAAAMKTQLDNAADAFIVMLQERNELKAGNEILKTRLEEVTKRLEDLRTKAPALSNLINEMLAFSAPGTLDECEGQTSMFAEGYAMPLKTEEEGQDGNS